MILYHYDEIKPLPKKLIDKKYTKPIWRFLKHIEKQKGFEKRRVSMSDICKNKPNAYLDFKRRNMQVIADYEEELELKTRILEFKEKYTLKV